MIGGIYSDEKCPVCGGVLKDNHKDGLTCPDHPKIYAQKMSVRFKKTHLRFTDYMKADQELSALRHNVKHYDARDFQKSKPLGFANLAQDWLRTKEGLASYRHMKRYVKVASEYFGNEHIREIQEVELEDFVESQGGEGKTLHLLMSALHNLFKWVWKRNKRTFSIDDFPEFPVIPYEMATRKPLAKETQWAVLDYIGEHCSRRTHLAIMILMAHTKIRPGDIPKVLEGDLDRERWVLCIPHPKEKRVKYVYLIEPEIELIKTLPLAMPHMPFFRHDKGGNGIRAGRVFGTKYLSSRWNEACEALGVEGTSIYPGTKHTSITGLNAIGYSPEDIQKHGSGHFSKSIMRYMLESVEREKEMSRQCLGVGETKQKGRVGK